MGTCIVRKMPKKRQATSIIAAWLNSVSARKPRGVVASERPVRTSRTPSRTKSTTTRSVPGKGRPGTIRATDRTTPSNQRRLIVPCSRKGDWCRDVFLHVAW